MATFKQMAFIAASILVFAGNLVNAQTVLSTVPTNTATGVALNATVSVIFSNNVTEADFSGISFSPAVTGILPTVTDNVLTIAHDAFDNNTSYTVTIPAGALNEYADAITWSFMTGTGGGARWTMDFDGDNVEWSTGNSVAGSTNMWQVTNAAQAAASEGFVWYFGDEAAANENLTNYMGVAAGNFAWIDIIKDNAVAGGSGHQNAQAWIRFDDIDLRGVSVPKIKFWHLYRKLNSSYGYVEWSVDNGTTWNTTPVYQGLGSNITKLEYLEVLLPTDDQGNFAGGNNDVSIRFRWDTDITTSTGTTPYGYFWAVDQIEIFDASGVLSHIPEFDAVNVETNVIISAIFEEPIAGTLENITITDTAGNPVSNVIGYSNGDTLTIEHDELNYGTTYTVTIPKSAISALIRDYSWSFTTEIAAPFNLEVEVQPNGNSALFSWNYPNEHEISYYEVFLNGASVGSTTQLNHTFENFQAGNYTAGVRAVYETSVSATPTENFVITMVTPPVISSRTPGVDAENVALDATVSVTFGINIITGVPAELENVTITYGEDSEVADVVATIEGAVLTIAHADFSYGTEYTVTIPDGAIEYYDGEITWSFTTLPALSVVNYIPAVDAENIALNSTVSVEFNRAITEIDFDGIKITYGEDSEVADVVATIEGAVLTIAHADFSYGTEYTVTIPDGAIEYYDGEITWSFTTLPALSVVNYIPAVDAENIALNSTVSVEFNRAITEIDFDGIKITYGEDSEVADVVATIEGAVLTIAHADFEYDTEYTVLIPSGSVSELLTDVTWSFTTVAATPVPITISSRTPKSGNLSIIMYPNPTKGWITVQGLEKENSLIQIYDITGRLVHTTTETSFDISHLTDKMYLLKAEGNVFKILKK